MTTFGIRFDPHKGFMPVGNYTVKEFLQAMLLNAQFHRNPDAFYRKIKEIPCSSNG
jgi:hypothetical protein